LAAVFADAASREFAQVGVVPYDHDGFVFGVATKQAAEIGETGTGAQAIVKMDFSFVPHFVAYQ